MTKNHANRCPEGLPRAIWKAYGWHYPGSYRRWAEYERNIEPQRQRERDRIAAELWRRAHGVPPLDLVVYRPAS